MKEQCRACRFWTGGYREDEPGFVVPEYVSGDCRRPAPVRGGEGYPDYGKAKWPVTKAVDGCGEFAARKRVNFAGAAKSLAGETGGDT